MATLPSYQEYLSGFQKQQTEQDAFLKSIGRVRVGNKVYVDPNYRTSKEQIGEQQAELNLRKTQQEADPAYVKQQALIEAEAKAEAAAKFPTETDATRAAKTSLKSVNTIVNQIKRLSQKVNTGSNILSQIPERIGAKTQINTDAALLESKSATLSQIIRALGEKGTLAEGDVQRAIRLVPQVGDTKKLAEAKIKDLTELLSSIGQPLEQAIGNQVLVAPKPLNVGRFKIEVE